MVAQLSDTLFSGPVSNPTRTAELQAEEGLLTSWRV